jgi:hypothetical protein
MSSGFVKNLSMSSCLGKPVAIDECPFPDLLWVGG